MLVVADAAASVHQRVPTKAQLYHSDPYHHCAQLSCAVHKLRLPRDGDGVVERLRQLLRPAASSGKELRVVPRTTLSASPPSAPTSVATRSVLSAIDACFARSHNAKSIALMMPHTCISHLHLTVFTAAASLPIALLPRFLVRPTQRPSFLQAHSWHAAASCTAVRPGTGQILRVSDQWHR